MNYICTVVNIVHIELIIKAIRAWGGGGCHQLKCFYIIIITFYIKKKKGNFEFIQFVLDHLNWEYVPKNIDFLARLVIIFSLRISLWPSAWPQKIWRSPRIMEGAKIKSRGGGGVGNFERLDEWLIFKSIYVQWNQSM